MMKLLYLLAKTNLEEPKMQKFEIIESKHWKHITGRTASIYGAVPWTSSDDAGNWSIMSAGWTVRNNQTGTVGTGRKPFQTKEEAEAFISQFN
jgi:hypothetical protein